MARTFAQLLDTLRSLGGDFTDVEVKSAAGGLPESLTSTLSALANQPGGGTIVLGLDENRGFRPVGLTNTQELKQGLAKKARAFTPPIRLTIADETVEGQPVVMAIVHECDESAKPCRISATGAAFMRGYDGDFKMSALEEQAFLSARNPPMFDRAPVLGATRAELDDQLVEDFTRNVQDRDRNGLGRFSGDELLRRAGALTADGIPTVAGLLALGIYPQEWLPRYVIQAAAEPLATDRPGTRARNQVTISGPIPRMLDAALDWARQTFDTAIVSQRDGTVVDVPAYPLAAFRELIANALLHRDLDSWSAGMAIEVRLRRDRLVVTNPGGLYGITLDRLGKEAVTSARNMWLVKICQYLRSPESGGRVIEALATGIPTITEALDAAGLPPAQYADSGIRFTVVLKTGTYTGAPQVGSKADLIGHTPAQTDRPTLNSTQQKIADLLAEGPATVPELQATVGLSAQGIRKALNGMRQAGWVEQVGGAGRRTTYRLTK
ncbi:ATP-binding protein [Nocardia sp. NPDC049149]|uniref:ATP-binding protein n=1 Tax=Nocardia sp. NPDC049149 TaxID=3364315 RepID=UPI00371CD0DA